MNIVHLEIVFIDTLPAKTSLFKKIPWTLKFSRALGCKVPALPSVLTMWGRVYQDIPPSRSVPLQNILG